MAEHDVKDSLYQQFARIGKALSSPRRLEILDLLAQGEKSVESLASHAGLSIANTSAHLRVLAEARLVERRKDAQWVFYRLAGADVFRLFRHVQDLSRQRLAEVEQIAQLYYEDRDRLDPVSSAELMRRMRENDVLVLDVRPEEEYRAGHVPDAVGIAPDDLERRLAGLPRDREIVAYCRGPYCLFSLQAVELLRKRGYRARRLDVGLPDWEAQGLPVVAGAAT